MICALLSAVAHPHTPLGPSAGASCPLEAYAGTGRWRHLAPDDPYPELIAALYTPKEIAGLVGRIGVRWTTGSGKERKAEYRFPDGVTENDLPALMQGEHWARQLTPHLRDHLEQLCRELKMTPKELAAAHHAGRLPARVLERLRSPVEQSNLKAGGMDVMDITPRFVPEYLEERIDQAIAAKGPRQLKIVLGGTKAKELEQMTGFVDAALRKVAARRGVPDVEKWVAEWQVEIVGYSIETAFLVEAENVADLKLPEYQKRWVRLEFLDLLDGTSMERMAAEKPDLVLTVGSLYLGRRFGVPRPDPKNKLAVQSRERADRDLLPYVERVQKMLKPGDAFVIERPEAIDPEFDGFGNVPRPPGAKLPSGVFVRGDGQADNSALVHPVAFLEGSKHPQELALYEGYQRYREGKRNEGAEAVYQALASYSGSASGSPAPRLSLPTLILVLDGYSGKHADAVSGLKKKLEGAEAERRKGKAVDLRGAIAGLVPLTS